MYINPVLWGVICTILVMMGLFILLLIWAATRKK